MALLLLAWLCSGKWLYWTAEREVFHLLRGGSIYLLCCLAGYLGGRLCPWYASESSQPGVFQLEGGGRQHSQELGAQVALVGVKEEIFCGAKEGLCSIDVALCRYTVWRLLLVNLCLELHHSQRVWVFFISLVLLCALRRANGSNSEPSGCSGDHPLGRKGVGCSAVMCDHGGATGQCFSCVQDGKFAGRTKTRLCCVLSLRSGETSEAVLCAFHKCKPLFSAVLG